MGKLLEAQCKDAATRADEAEVNALKGGRKAMIKMGTRIRELESELDAETRRFGDVTENLRKSERSIKELSFAADEDRKNHERMQALIDQLQGKVKSYKKQLNSDLDEMTNEARLSEDKAARAMVDAARLADELRCEQELAMNLEKDKKLLEAQCKDAATRADEAEVNALKEGQGQVCFPRTLNRFKRIFQMTTARIYQ